MPQVARLVMEILGVGAEQARRILCASPTVLLGKISANTVAALQTGKICHGNTFARARRPDEIVETQSNTDQALPYW